MKVYLAGPIANCTDEECMGWRDYVTSLLGEENVLNPMRRDYRGVDVASPEEIVEGDKRDIDEASVVLVNYTPNGKPMVGTSMEVLYAWERGKTVIVVTKYEVLSPWLVYHCHHICRTFVHAVSILKESETR